MKVYVITAGEYSDYHICAVTDNPVSAENLRVYYTTSFYDHVFIETFETKSLPERPKTCWYCRYGIRNGMDNYGIVDCIEVRYVSKENTDMWEFRETKINNVEYSFGTFYVHVFARDKEHAKKVAAEKIYQYKYMCESIGKDPWNDDAPDYPTSLASSTVSDDMIEKLKEGKPVDEFSFSFYKEGD